MRKAIINKNRKIEIINSEEPHIHSDDDVKIQIAYCAVCPDDLFFLNNAPINNIPVHTSIGHEFTGTIVQLGRKAASMGLSRGDRVTGFVWHFCGNCPYCKQGKPWLCLNISDITGAFQDYIVMKCKNVYLLPENLSLKNGCFAEVVSGAMRAIQRSGLLTGQSVLILGGGGCGQIMLQLCQKTGASTIAVSDPMISKRTLALQNGSDYVLNPFDPDFLENVMEITEYLGFDVIFDLTFNSDAIQQSINCLARGGTLVLSSLHAPEQSLSVNLCNMYLKEQSLVSIFMAPYHMYDAIKMLPHLHLDSLFGAEFPLEELNAAFESQSRSEYPRVVIKM